MRITDKNRVLLFAAMTLMFIVSACTVPGMGVSTSPSVEEPSPTTPADTPVVEGPVATATEAPAAAEPTATTAEPPAAGLLRQWATGATASSEYGSESWSAQQATGAPDTMECGDIQTAWASETSDGVDWLELSFVTAVVPTEINIRETYSPGFIARVEVKDERGIYHTVWEGTPEAVEQCPRVLTIPVSGVSVPVSVVRINLDQREGGYYNEIDAVELVGLPSTSPVVEPTATPSQPPVAGMTRQWAIGATASSEYGSDSWSAQQATGAPDTMECDDLQTAWASETSDGVDWLEVSFATAVVPTEINIRETNSPGFINRVEVRDDMGLYHIVWEGTPGAVEQCPRVFSVAVSGVGVRVNAVRISLDQRNGGWYNEIDAVELVGQE